MKKNSILLMSGIISIQATLDLQANEEINSIKQKIEEWIPNFTITDTNFSNLKMLECYTFSQKFKDGQSDMSLFAILLYPILKQNKIANDNQVMRWVRSNLRYDPYILEVFVALANIQKPDKCDYEMFGKIIKTLKYFKEENKVIGNMIAYMMRQSFIELTDKYCYSDVSRWLNDTCKQDLREYVGLMLKNPMKLLEYSDSSIGISIKSDDIENVTLITDSQELNRIRQDPTSQDIQLCVEFLAYILKRSGTSFIMHINSGEDFIKAFLLLVYIKSSLTDSNFNRETFNQCFFSEHRPSEDLIERFFKIRDKVFMMIANEKARQDALAAAEKARQDALAAAEKARAEAAAEKARQDALAAKKAWRNQAKYLFILIIVVLIAVYIFAFHPAILSTALAYSKSLALLLLNSF